MTNSDFNEHFQSLHRYIGRFDNLQDYWPEPVNLENENAANAIADTVAIVSRACEGLMVTRLVNTRFIDFQGSRYQQPGDLQYWEETRGRNPDFHIQFNFEIDRRPAYYVIPIFSGLLTRSRRYQQFTQSVSRELIERLVGFIEEQIQPEDENYQIKADAIRLRVWKDLESLMRRTCCAVFDLRFNLFSACLEIEYKLAWNGNNSRRSVVIGLSDFDLLSETRDAARHIIDRMEMAIDEDKRFAELRSGLLPFDHQIAHPTNRGGSVAFWGRSISPQEAHDLYDALRSTPNQSPNGFAAVMRNHGARQIFFNGRLEYNEEASLGNQLYPLPNKKPDRPKACMNCEHYIGSTYYSEDRQTKRDKFICAMHPYGPDGDECPDWEEKECPF